MSSYLRAGPPIAGHLAAEAKDVVTWTCIISTHTANARHDLAWQAFLHMLRQPDAAADRPNAYTVSAALKAGKGVDGGRRSGPLLHGLAIKLGVGGDVYVQNGVVEVYAWGGAMECALKVFDGMGERSVVSWTTVMSALARTGQAVAAIATFRRMLLQDGVKMSEFGCSIALNACSSLGFLTLGQQLHAAAVVAGHTTCLPVANSLINMYCKCNNVCDAHLYFDSMPQKDVITWNTMLAGMKRTAPVDALHLFSQMCGKHHLVKPNCFTLTTVIAACADMAALHCGEQLHGFIIRWGFNHYMALENALMDMYAKCGCISSSQSIFNDMENKDLLSWTTMMLGYGNHGHGHDAIQLFEEMILLGHPPDEVVFMGLLSACNHAGLVDKGVEYYHSMQTKYGVIPDLPIYGCVVDMLGRAGRVEEAYDVVNTMPFAADESVWGALLGACKLHRNVELGKLAAFKMLELRPQDKLDALMYLSNIFAADGRWIEFAKTRKIVKEMGRKKEVGMSWVELGGDVYSFCSAEIVNPSLGFVCDVLQSLNIVMRDVKIQGQILN